MKVTACLTSCGRHDLLTKTLESLFKFNTYPIEAFYVYEDGMDVDDYKKTEIICNRFGITLIDSLPFKAGQIKAVDALYAKVETEYIFHLEDDWSFYKSGFIEQSLSILQAKPKIVNVWIRSVDDTNGHPVEKVVFNYSGVPFRYLAPTYKSIWHGFTFNPGLRRLSDYKRLGSYSKLTTFNPKHPAQSEAAIGKWYWRNGYRAVIIDSKEGFVKHIGWGQTVKA